MVTRRKNVWGKGHWQNLVLVAGVAVSLAACDSCNRDQSTDSSALESMNSGESGLEEETVEVQGEGKEEAMAQSENSALVSRDDVAAAIEKVKSSNTLEAVIETEGTGPVASNGQRVHVHYTGYLIDGQKFDSSRDRGQAFDFTLGQGQVIAGWDQGVSGMKVGERKILVIPSEMGYGSRGAGSVIPPDSILVFDVELLEVK